MTLCALEAKGALLGFVTLQPRSGELDQIAVAPWAARRGLGRLLLGEARALAPGVVTVATTPATVWYPNQSEAAIEASLDAYRAFLG